MISWMPPCAAHWVCTEAICQSSTVCAQPVSSRQMLKHIGVEGDRDLLIGASFRIWRRRWRALWTASDLWRYPACRPRRQPIPRKEKRPFRRRRATASRSWRRGSSVCARRSFGYVRVIAVWTTVTFTRSIPSEAPWRAWPTASAFCRRYTRRTSQAICGFHEGKSHASPSGRAAD